MSEMFCEHGRAITHCPTCAPKAALDNALSLRKYYPKAESDENTKGPFVVISMSALRLCLAEAYEAVRDTPTPVYVELKLADILTDVEK